MYKRQVQDPARQLNAVPRVVATISMHPADADMHKDEEHKFDMKEVYLFRRGKDVLTGSFNNVREGDVLLMPVVMKRQGDGSFRPLMEQGTLLMTSKLTGREPAVSYTHLEVYKRQEVPYALTVEPELWERRADNSVRAEMTIYVERDSQKQIVLGRGGTMIKKIGHAARRELEELLEDRIHLFLFVKVRENWGDDPARYADWNLDYRA